MKPTASNPKSTLLKINNASFSDFCISDSTNRTTAREQNHLCRSSEVLYGLSALHDLEQYKSALADFRCSVAHILIDDEASGASQVDTAIRIASNPTDTQSP